MSFNPSALDRQIEGDDRDDEPRDLCPECGEERGDCDWMCSYSDHYYEPDAVDVEPSDD